MEEERTLTLAHMAHIGRDECMWYIEKLYLSKAIIFCNYWTLFFYLLFLLLVVLFSFLCNIVAVNEILWQETSVAFESNDAFENKWMCEAWQSVGCHDVPIILHHQHHPHHHHHHHTSAVFLVYFICFNAYHIEVCANIIRDLYIENTWMSLYGWSRVILALPEFTLDVATVVRREETIC